MTENQFQERSLGDTDSIRIDGTALVKGPFYCLQALADGAVIATLDAPRMGGTKTAISLAGGQHIVGHFLAVTLTSGDLIAYYTR